MRADPGTRSRTRTYRRALLAALVAAMPSTAGAACLAPTPPEVAAKPAKPQLPAKPPCADAKPGTAGCLGWESYSYSDAVKAYNAQLPVFQAAANAYVAKLNAYVAASGEYARCEVKSLQ